MIPSSDPSKPKSSFFSEWLEKLQQESWQLELLISGLALFGIWESRSMLVMFEYYLTTNTIRPYDLYANLFVDILWAGWGIFMVNLLIHIIIRGLWIGAIGLRYVSGDIDFDELNYSEIFRKYFKRRLGSFDNYIERLEKLSSVLFSFTFLLFFMFFSFVFVNIVFGTIASTINSITGSSSAQPSRIAIISLGLLYVLGFLVLIDFFTLGGFKKVKDKTFSRIYFWIYRFYSTVSLSFIYRPLLLNFIDNRYTKRLFFLAIPYVLILLFGVRLSYFNKYSFIPSYSNEQRFPFLVDKYAINWNNYDDLRKEHHNTYSTEDPSIDKSSLPIASLSNYEIEGNTGELFLKYLKRDSDLLERQNPDFSIFKKSGYRHSIFSSGNIDDPQYDAFVISQSNEIRGMLKVVREQETELDSIEQALISNDISWYRTQSKDNISSLRGDIERKYTQRRREYIDDKIQKARAAILSNYTILIDDISYTDSLECYFYTHPNMHEKGLMCYFPTENMKEGSHLLHIKKRRNRDDCTDDCPYIEKYIPFRKI